MKYICSFGISDFLSHCGFSGLGFLLLNLLYSLIGGSIFFRFLFSCGLRLVETGVYGGTLCVEEFFPPTVVTIYLTVLFVSVSAICWVRFWVSCILGYGGHFVFFGPVLGPTGFHLNGLDSFMECLSFHGICLV